MKIGTALTPGATRVMLLGAGELGKEVTISLQRYGVEVIAVDRYAGAPAQQVAHRSHAIDMTDAFALKQLVEREKPHFIVPEIEAIATQVLEEIERAGLATVIPTARAVRLTMDREGIRRLVAEELGLPTSPYVFTDTLEGLREAAQVLGYPCFVKPIMSSSGKGQSLVHGADELEAAWNCSQEGGRVKNARIIVEGKVEFDYEITLLTVRALNVAGQVETHFCAPVGHLQVKGDYVESWQPQPMTPSVLAESRRIAGLVVDNLGGRGLYGVELFIRGDQVWFSEVSPRPHDTGMVTMITQAQNEFELHARAFLGLPVSTTLRQAGASAVLYGGVDAEGVTFEGLEQALATEGTEVRLFGKPVSSVRRRLGVALATAEDIGQARAKARDAATRIRVDKP
jgi:phosphoribosylglycinamide formyltransferase 2